MTSLTMKGALQRWAGRLATAATLGLAAAGPGQAAVYVGTFDPQFGAPFTNPPGPFNLGWEGEVRLNVPTACQGISMIVNTGFGACSAAGGVTVESVYVDLFNWDNPSDPINPRIRLNFNTTSLAVYSLKFGASGELLHLDTSRTNLVSGSPLTDVFSSPYFEFALQFLFDNDLCDGVPSCEDDEPPLYSGPLLFYTDSGFCTEGCEFADVRQFPPTLIFTPVPPDTPVPAPAALWLAIAALGAAGGVTARARRRAA